VPAISQQIKDMMFTIQSRQATGGMVQVEKKEFASAIYRERAVLTASLSQKQTYQGVVGQGEKCEAKPHGGGRRLTNFLLQGAKENDKKATPLDDMSLPCY